jgi:zinc protease
MSRRTNRASLTFTASQMLEGHDASHRRSDLERHATPRRDVEPAVISGESGNVALSATRDKLRPALDILADVMVNPTFPQDALERYRARTLINLTQARDRNACDRRCGISESVVRHDHPYGRTMSEASRKSDHARRHRRVSQGVFPTGSCGRDGRRRHQARRSEAHVRSSVRKLESRRLDAVVQLSGRARQPKQTTIYLVDKPGAASSTFALGHIGPPRSTKDYYAIRVMKRAAWRAVSVASQPQHPRRKRLQLRRRLRLLIRPRAGPFRAGGDIMTAKNDSALVEFMKELKDIRGGRPPSDDELAQAKASLVQSLPASFESVAGLNGNIATIYLQGCPRITTNNSRAP